jgi:hypothetical protein
MSLKKSPTTIWIISFLVLVFIFQEIRFYSERKYNNAQQSILLNELDQIEEKVANLETSLGRSFVNAQKIPRPLIFCGDTIDLDNHFIRERVEREFYSLLGDQGQLQLYMKRTQKYLPLFEKHLKEAGLPDDLKYLSVHESALIPRIRSRSRAVGLWQFMYATGRLYKLRIDRYIDERRDPEKATKAAIRFLSDLYKKFEKWPLVLAGYNGGQGRIHRSVINQKSNNLIDLSLPEETERYFFKVVATKIILSQPEEFGFKFEDDDYFVSLPTVRIEFKINKSKMSLEEISELFEMPIIAVKEYNPQIRTTYLPMGSYQLNLPEENYAIYVEKMESKQKIPFVEEEISLNDENNTSEVTMSALK